MLPFQFDQTDCLSLFIVFYVILESARQIQKAFWFYVILLYINISSSCVVLFNQLPFIEFEANEPFSSARDGKMWRYCRYLFFPCSLCNLFFDVLHVWQNKVLMMIIVVSKIIMKNGQKTYQYYDFWVKIYQFQGLLLGGRSLRVFTKHVRQHKRGLQKKKRQF